ncbi:hypothetical protein AAT19DRAFT_9337 [Rhodotorula toruloides]|uniref:Uncharacterized protein n=1 Tax=Rhodotorula toruloides TaxID=5286 RepID=A0A2T0A1V9_RHOTO|nr:hypothetical protein AAT19DRAFT_9337 [Rhodotorula toruloides]
MGLILCSGQPTATRRNRRDGRPTSPSSSAGDSSSESTRSRDTIAGPSTQVDIAQGGPAPLATLEPTTQDGLATTPTPQTSQHSRTFPALKPALSCAAIIESLHSLLPPRRRHHIALASIQHNCRLVLFRLARQRARVTPSYTRGNLRRTARRAKRCTTRRKIASSRRCRAERPARDDRVLRRRARELVSKCCSSRSTVALPPAIFSPPRRRPICARICFALTFSPTRLEIRQPAPVCITDRLTLGVILVSRDLSDWMQTATMARGGEGRGAACRVRREAMMTRL